MLMIDIDLFKGVNDLHGYAIGDLLLIHVADDRRDRSGIQPARATRRG